MPIEKRSCLARAKQLLTSSEPETIRYAALELRLCMEALTYEKLRAFSSMIPESVLATWQPPQAVKTLLEFEPRADKSFVLAAGKEEHYGQPSKEMQYVGEHKALAYRWLRKHYNKVGNLLHVPAANSGPAEDPNTHMAYLNAVVADLDEALSGNIYGGSIREVFRFECAVCNQPVVCNAETTSKTNRAVCLNPQCGAEYFATVAPDGLPGFQLKVTKFDCISCKALIPVENRKLDIGVKFECASCGQRHSILSREWQYGAEESS